MQRVNDRLIAGFSNSLTACLTAGLPGQATPRPRTIGVAVSGGSDSTALLVLAVREGAKRGLAVEAVTLDHRLRPEAADEARAVSRLCAGLGVHHDILTWHHDGPLGNLQAAARAARRRLISDWARQRGIAVVALGHTMDDQAETFLMRLERGSGVDGLAAMSARRRGHGIDWIRPLLGMRRDELRGFLVAEGIAWADDPSNENPAYGRVRVRRALAVLEGLGLTVEGIAKTTARLQMSRAALEDATETAARRMATVSRAGSVSLDMSALAQLPEDIRRRLFAHALMWVGGAPYRPRLTALIGALEATAGGRRSTLAGCLITPHAGAIEISREPAAVAAMTAPPDALWDGRWRFEGGNGATAGLYVGALGEAGLRDCTQWRETGLGRASLLASPALWRAGADAPALVAAPLAGWPCGWTCRRIPACEDFASAVLSH